MLKRFNQEQKYFVERLPWRLNLLQNSIVNKIIKTQKMKRREVKLKKGER